MYEGRKAMTSENDEENKKRLEEIKSQWKRTQKAHEKYRQAGLGFMAGLSAGGGVGKRLRDAKKRSLQTVSGLQTQALAARAESPWRDRLRCSDRAISRVTAQSAAPLFRTLHAAHSRGLLAQATTLPHSP